MTEKQTLTGRPSHRSELIAALPSLDFRLKKAVDNGINGYDYRDCDPIKNYQFSQFSQLGVPEGSTFPWLRVLINSRLDALPWPRGG